MLVITNILPQQKNKDRFSIYIDDKFAFGLMQSNLLRLGLEVGQQLTDQELKSLQEEVLNDAVLLNAYSLLSFRPRSKKELQFQLKRKFPDTSLENIDRVLEYLEEKKQIDDFAFAEWWVQQRREVGTRMGVFRVKQELIHKGVTPEIIDEVLKNSINEVSERDNALRVGEKVLKTTKGKDQYHIKQKFLQSLVRKGFSWEQAQDVYHELTSARDSS